MVIHCALWLVESALMWKYSAKFDPHTFALRVLAQFGIIVWLVIPCFFFIFVFGMLRGIRQFLFIPVCSFPAPPSVLLFWVELSKCGVCHRRRILIWNTGISLKSLCSSWPYSIKKFCFSLDMPIQHTSLWAIVSILFAAVTNHHKLVFLTLLVVRSLKWVSLLKSSVNGIVSLVGTRRESISLFQPLKDTYLVYSPYLKAIQKYSIPLFNSDTLGSLHINENYYLHWATLCNTK